MPKDLKVGQRVRVYGFGPALDVLTGVVSRTYGERPRVPEEAGGRVSRIEEIRAMYERERDVAAFRHSMLPIEYCAIGDLLAERDRLAAEVEAARDSLAAIADEPGCCADIADTKAFAREALAKLGTKP